ncbi:MAG: RidA family protein [Betaproteobacteria bacterium]|nr:RidA family protein [Betaproteobacteria bacterium]
MSRLLPLAVLAAALSISTLSQAAEAPGKTIIIPDKSERAYTQYHYAPAIKVGDTVIVSGIPAGGPGTYTEQVRRMFLRAKATLEAAGATMEDVIELQSFHVNAKTTADFQKEFAEFLDVHKEFFKEGYPAWTAIGNAVLLAQGAVVEVKFVAVIGAGKKMKVERVAPAAASK